MPKPLDWFKDHCIRDNKRVIRFAPTLFILLSLALVTSPASALNIMLDPGHGGWDNGAVRKGVKESDLVLKVAQDLQKKLASDPRIQASLTRSSDQSLTLQERLDKAQAEGAELFVSLHANAAADPRARGVEVFFQNHLPPDEDALFLANLENQKSEIAKAQGQQDPSKQGDLAAILEDLNRQHRLRESWQLSRLLTQQWTQSSTPSPAVIKQAPFYVISQSKTPSVLIELGFLSNPQELVKLSSPSYQRNLTEKIFNALLKYKEIIDKRASSGQITSQVQ